MAKLTCKICEKQYDCCQTSIDLQGWRSVCCCEEHYQEFMRQHFEWVEQQEKLSTK